MEPLYFFCQQMLLSIVPLLIVALAGIYSEKGGVLNFSLEGLMLIGAFCGAFFIHFMPESMSGNSAYLIALAIAGIAGAGTILLQGVAAIKLNGEQIISGMAINLLIPPLTIVIARAVIGILQVRYDNTFRIAEVPFFSKIPIIGDIFFKNTYISSLIGLVFLIVTVIVFKYSRFGMRLMACGEHPQAAAAVGINVARTRCIGVLISGFFSGLGGLAFVLPNAAEYSATVAGYGYLAVAVVIFGQWKPLPILFASLFFGALKTFASIYVSIPFFASHGTSSYIFKMTPYLATIVVLIFTSKKSGQPAALAKPYDLTEL
jgi:simple sugar transport system permease protein